MLRPTREGGRNGWSRRNVEMGVRVLTFSHANPDTDAGVGVSVAKLGQLLGRVDQIATARPSGLSAACAG